MRHATKAVPRPPFLPGGHYRLRQDRLDKSGRVTLRYQSRLRHIGVGRAHAGTRVYLLVADRDVHILTAEEGELLGRLTIDPDKDYQPIERPLMSGMS